MTYNTTVFNCAWATWRNIVKTCMNLQYAVTTSFSSLSSLTCHWQTGPQKQNSHINTLLSTFRSFTTWHCFNMMFWRLKHYERYFHRVKLRAKPAFISQNNPKTWTSHQWRVNIIIKHAMTKVITYPHWALVFKTLSIVLLLRVKVTSARFKVFANVIWLSLLASILKLN